MHLCLRTEIPPRLQPVTVAIDPAFADVVPLVEVWDNDVVHVLVDLFSPFCIGSPIPVTTRGIPLSPATRHCRRPPRPTRSACRRRRPLPRRPRALRPRCGCRPDPPSETRSPRSASSRRRSSRRRTETAAARRGRRPGSPPGPRGRGRCRGRSRRGTHRSTTGWTPPGARWSGSRTVG